MISTGSVDSKPSVAFSLSYSLEKSILVVNLGLLLEKNALFYRSVPFSFWYLFLQETALRY